MALELYTSTYTDIDTNVFDADDLLTEFWRISSFINLWADSAGSTGVIDTYEIFVTIVDTVVNGSPANGIIQVMYVASDVETIAVDFTERGDGETYRIYMTLRFQNKDTTFTVSGPGGETHMFGINRALYTPGQKLIDGYYTATIMATYGGDNGVMINVFSDNSETTSVSKDDSLGMVSL